MANHYGLILAGGRGTRFWPRSRKRSAKQVLNVVGERDLIQATVDRLAPVIPPERMWILTNDHLRDEIVEQLPEVPEAADPGGARAAQHRAGHRAGGTHSRSRSDPEAVMGVFPRTTWSASRPLPAGGPGGVQGAAGGQLMVLGIPPRWPETGYGYVEFPKGTQPGGCEPRAGACASTRSRNWPRRKRYVKAGNFYWNSGMFFWRADVLLDELRQHLPKDRHPAGCAAPLRIPQVRRAFEEVVSRCAKTSRSITRCWKRPQNVAALPLRDFGWNDVGSWNAVYELLARDGFGNALSARFASAWIPTTTSSMPAASWSRCWASRASSSSTPRMPC